MQSFLGDPNHFGLFDGINPHALHEGVHFDHIQVGAAMMACLSAHLGTTLGGGPKVGIVEESMDLFDDHHLQNSRTNSPRIRMKKKN